ncbi:hypothetical protein J1N35_007429 [Gossypium stocksii]|uniref:Uncharacterized protein n=1 Tax=Gossypium stocksii TaxID=47602 RepID=A0A9D3W6P9_9ROSI|nr:hypothetical protein J1N35_007429 [Gossypium stocksii]
MAKLLLSRGVKVGFPNLYLRTMAPGKMNLIWFLGIEMECCMDLRALKSSVREMTMQNTHHVFDDFLVMNVMNGAVAGEDFSIDCFLDFNNEEFEEGSVEEEEKNSISTSYQQRVADDDSNSNSTSFTHSVPDDEIAGLEWVSHLVDDSVPEIPLSCPVFKQETDNHAGTRFEAESGPVIVITILEALHVASSANSLHDNSS